MFHKGNQVFGKKGFNTTILEILNITGHNIVHMGMEGSLLKNRVFIISNSGG